MHLRRLWLRDFRSYEAADLELSAGTCVVTGPNGMGKSNLLEAVGYLAMLESFRGAPAEAMVRRDSTTAVIRGEIVSAGREQLVEAEISPGGRSRVLVNKQRLNRSRDLLGTLRVTVFSPDDLSIVKGGPGLRRGYLDQLLVDLDSRNDVLRADFDKTLRQRNALLKQVRGRLDESAELTLAVWDSKLVETGEKLADKRRSLIADLSPLVQRAYEQIAGERCETSLSYQASWSTVGLAEALRSARSDELRRGVSLVGPHRDDLHIGLNSMPARTHSSQGEQRCIALALRLGGHKLVSDRTGEPPILLLDDVFSELDDDRSSALLTNLPPGQRLLSTAARLPTDVHPDQVLIVGDGRVSEGPR